MGRGYRASPGRVATEFSDYHYIYLRTVEEFQHVTSGRSP